MSFATEAKAARTLELAHPFLGLAGLIADATDGVCH